MSYNKECRTESKVDEALAVGMLAGNFPEDPALKTHALCMAKKLEILTEDGQIQNEKLKEKLVHVVSDEGKINEIVDSCSQEKGSPEETAYEMAKCVYKATH